MTIPKNAKITYEVDGKTTEIRFHGVMAEDHAITTEISKYPTQAAFIVSNHAIRKNRLVGLKALVTNTVILGQGESIRYSSNNSKTIYNELNSLVRNAIPCVVQTNLGTYDPVIFTSFSNTQKAGVMDSMEVSLKGEEVQLADSTNKIVPTAINFERLEGGLRTARILELEKSGIEVPENAVISTANVNLQESFKINTVNDLGKSVTCTYEKKYTDPVTKKTMFDVHTDEVDVVASIEETVDLSPLLQGVSTAAMCMQGGIIDIASDESDDYIDTKLGELAKSQYGAYYKVLGITDNPRGQALLALGMDCFVAGVAGQLDPSQAVGYEPPSTPTVDDMLSGASELGDRAASTSPITSVTKISAILR